MSLAVGYNGGESARRALEAAIALARDLEETLLVVCGVCLLYTSPSPRD